MHLFFAAVPIFAAILVVVFWTSPGIRVLGILAICGSAFMCLGTLIAPHRLAEELLYDARQNEEWMRGARDTESVVRQVIPIFISTFLSLSVLVLFNLRSRNPSRKTTEQAGPSHDH